MVFEMDRLLPFLTFVAFLGLSNGQVCPPREVLVPCKCEEGGKPYIYCSTNSTLDIKAIFDRASEFVGEDVVFESLDIRGIANVEIEEGAIQHLKFGEIKITSSKNLEWISPNAVGASRNVTTKLFMQVNNLSNDAPRDRDIFDLVNNFQNLRKVYLGYNRLTSIPSNALQNLQILDHLSLSNNRIGRNIGSRAFASGGQNLKTIDLSNNDIPSSGLPEDAFEGVSPSASVDLMFNGHRTLQQESYQSLLDRVVTVRVGTEVCGPVELCFPMADIFCDRRMDWLCDKQDVYRPKISFLCRFPSLFRDIWRYCDYRNNSTML